MRIKEVLMLALLTGVFGSFSCGSTDEGVSSSGPASSPTTDVAGDRPYLLERVDDAAVVQLYADGFELLPLREKILIWHLYNAALAGRDIFYDQRYIHNLVMREVLEEIITHSQDVDPETLEEIHRYTKLFWLNTGPYNSLTARKFVLQCSPEAFALAATAAVAAGAQFPIGTGETLEQFLGNLQPMFFDLNFDPSVTSKAPGSGQDILTASANNLYVGVTMDELEGFEERYGLNSRLVDHGDQLVEEVYRIGDRYSDQITEIVEHLEAAVPFASDSMSSALQALIKWYQTGEEADRRVYDIAWVEDKDSTVDTINGFTEVYMDARGVKGSWEALVFYVNEEKTRAIETLATNAQWFEDHMPWDPRYRKDTVRGITANAIEVVVETGDSGPTSPIGINLPNDQEIREQYGSKSVSLSNVVEAYDKSRPEGFLAEFVWTKEEAMRAERWGSLVGELSTNMHEVIGHGSGQLSEQIEGDPQSALREHYSALEEGRADLVALYFIADPKLVELGLVPEESQEDIVLAEYEAYTRNALVQLRRVREGNQLEQDHMRNRQMIIHWLIGNSEAIEIHRRDEKTYYVMADSNAFREGVGRLLEEVQRIKSEGDYESAKQLFDSYGVQFDPVRRDEVVARVDNLNLPSYSGFVQPQLKALTDSDGTITDIKISYPQDLMKQMLQYSGKALPN